MTNIEVHRSHCCVLHGCKYVDVDCAVASWEVVQEFPCVDCTWGEDGEELEVRVETSFGQPGDLVWLPWTDAVYSSPVEAVRVWHELTDYQPECEMRGLDPMRVRLRFRRVSRWVTAAPSADYDAFGG